MGAFNVVLVPERCTNCGSAIERRVQFAWGDVWQLEYRIGDKLRWGGNDEGDPGLARVTVDGAAETCPICGSPGSEGVVVIVRDVLTDWLPDDEGR